MVQEVQKTDREKSSLLEDRQTCLELFLSVIAKVVLPNHYTTVMKHSTSLGWVFDRIREDYDIQTRGILRIAPPGPHTLFKCIGPKLDFFRKKVKNLAEY